MSLLTCGGNETRAFLGYAGRRRWRWLLGVWSPRAGGVRERPRGRRARPGTGRIRRKIRSRKLLLREPERRRRGLTSIPLPRRGGEGRVRGSEVRGPEVRGSGGAAERHLAPRLAEQPLVGLRVRLRRDAQHGVLAGGGDGRRGSAEKEFRVAPGSHRANALAHDLAEHDHAAIRRGEMLEGVHGDVALARLRVVVGGVPLALLVRPV